jgi:hypothetical protein
MSDRKPPRAHGDERAVLLALLDFHRWSFVGKLTGVTDEQARWSPVPTGTSLAGLGRHLAIAETLWVEVRFAGRPEALDRLDDTADLPVTAVIEQYRATWARTDAVIAASDLDTMCSAIDVEPNVDLRWVVAHLLEETARHAGHADIIRELIDGATGR